MADDRRFVLVKFLGYETEEYEDFKESKYEDNVFSIGWGNYYKEYAVYTDEEADEAAIEAARQDAWVFSPWLLAGNTGLPEEVFTPLVGMCENGSEAIAEIVDRLGDWQELVDDVGRGQILATENGAEDEFVYRRKLYFIYRRS